MLRLCLAVDLPTEGRVSKQGRCPFDENSLGARSVANLKDRKHNRVKRAHPAFCPHCLYCEVRARHGVISLTLPMKRGLGFHRPADLLRAGVSQIQFQTFFFSFQYTSQLTILLPDPSAYRCLNKG